MRDIRQILSVWLSLWFLLLNVVAVPMCHAPSGVTFDGQPVVLCHVDDDNRSDSPLDDNGGPAGNADHCSLCFVCQLLSGGLPALAPVSALGVPVRIGSLPLPGRTMAPPIRLAIGPQQPRAPPAIL